MDKKRSDADGHVLDLLEEHGMRPSGVFPLSNSDIIIFDGPYDTDGMGNPAPEKTRHLHDH